jgi:hypothetical protein
VNQRRRRRPSATTLVLTAVGGVVVAIVIVGAVLNLISDPDVDVNLGDEVFEVGRSTLFAREIAEDGPLLFQALVGDRDIYVQHVGPKVREGWLSFETRAPGQPRRCQLEWRQGRKVFVDSCNDRVYPADGSGLVHYRAVVNRDGDVVVDLRRRISPTTTTAAVPSTTAVPG